MSWKQSVPHDMSSFDSSKDIKNSIFSSWESIAEDHIKTIITSGIQSILANGTDQEKYLTIAQALTTSSKEEFTLLKEYLLNLDNIPPVSCATSYDMYGELLMSLLDGSERENWSSFEEQWAN